MHFAYTFIFLCNSISADVLVNIAHVIALILFMLIDKFYSLNLLFRIECSRVNYILCVM